VPELEAPVSVDFEPGFDAPLVDSPLPPDAVPAPSVDAVAFRESVV
jgi:hypothetical protein